MGHGNKKLKIELARAFIPVLVTSNFDDDSIKSEWARMETSFSHYKSMRTFLVVSGPTWPKFELVRDFMHVLVTCKYKKDGSKTTEKRWIHHFPHRKSMGAFCCYGHHSFDPICPKTLCSLSPTSMMLHIKFGQDWPTGFRDIQVQKCELFITQGQVTPKWVVWFGPKSNSTELLCLPWLPATLMMIQSKMNELAWRHHFPIISLCEFLHAQGQLTP